MPQYWERPSPLLSAAFHFPPDRDISISTHSFMKIIPTTAAALVELLLPLCPSMLIALPWPELFAPLLSGRFRFTTWRLSVPKLPLGVSNHPVVTANSFS